MIMVRMVIRQITTYSEIRIETSKRKRRIPGTHVERATGKKPTSLRCLTLTRKCMRQQVICSTHAAVKMKGRICLCTHSQVVVACVIATSRLQALILTNRTLLFFKSTTAVIC